MAVLTYAKYIINEAPGVPAHQTRTRWAQSVYANPDLVAGQVQPPTVMQDLVQEQGAEITDPDLQTAVETAVNTIL